MTELSKVNAPSMLLLDFNYFFNKAINQYINKRYNIYDINQQTTDDLRVLKATTLLTPSKLDNGLTSAADFAAGLAKLFGGTYYVDLPLDYLHMLNCVCVYTLADRYKCYNLNDAVAFAAKRLTGDSWSVVMNDFYNRPLPERPYYYINNINQSVDLPTNSYDITNNTALKRGTVGTDASKDYPSNTNPSEFTGGNLPRTIDLKNFTNLSVVEKEAGVRYGNSSNVRCEIRYGHDNSVFVLKEVLIDYIKAPQVIRLTQEQVNLTKDTSLIMEFPDYVCLEIINELVQLVMENTADPRLLTHNAVTNTIANPVQQLPTQPVSGYTRRQPLTASN